MKRIALVFISVLFAAGCVSSKSPDAVEQEMSGSYKLDSDSKKTAVVIMGAYNNLEAGEIQNLSETLQWASADGEIAVTDFSDTNNPLYIKGRNGVNYIAVKVFPGKYTLKNFVIKWSDAAYDFNLDFGKRYSADFEIAEGEVMFVGIIRTTFAKFSEQELKLPGKTEIKVSSFLENGKEDLYRVTSFYNMITKKPVKTQVMYWNDSVPGSTQSLIAARQKVNP
ncbi:MAG: hypothetical protein LBR69_07175 [Endomicrobium sp.]|jgi:hypothetical protein|nr:hypothetical protein [Endomicrobium sp.]